MDSGNTTVSDATTSDADKQSVEERVQAKLDAVQGTGKSDVEEVGVSEIDVSAGASSVTTPASSEKNTSDKKSVVEKALAKSDAGGRGEVSASTIARMMGVATTNELSMLEGKIDLLSSRINNITAKLERFSGVLGRLPTSTDFDRIDINIGSLRTLIKESLELLTTTAEKEKATGDEGTLKRATIMSSSDSKESDESKE